jgi:glycogen operon protein
LANGENNRDGENHNNSWNHGVEGPSSDRAIQALRRRQQRNLLSTLLLSRGVPMLLMGDEVGRSQGGNNNTWCQDSPLSWMIWSDDHCDHELQTYVQRLLNVRQQLAVLFNPTRPHNEKKPLQSSDPNELWRQWHGVELSKPDWANWSHCLAMSLQQGHEGAVLWMGFNAYFKSMHFDLPEAATPWCRLIDTALPAGEDLPTQIERWSPSGVPLEARSLVVMVAQTYADQLSL